MDQAAEPRPKAPAGPSDAWMTDGTGHPRRWAILGVLMVSLLVVVLDNTVLNIALPTIQRDLEATQSELVWAIDSYILVFAALLFTWGVLGDRFGRRRILIIGLTVFGAASALSAFAATPEWLVMSRGLMGVGGAAVMPVTLAIITVVFPPHERGRAIGAWAGAVGGAVALGPVLGGLLLQHPEWSSWATGNDWGAVFLINVPVVIVGVLGILRVVPETRNPHPQRLDIIGLVSSFVGMVLLVYGIIHASSVRSWTAAEVLVPIFAGVVIIVGFLVYEAKSRHKSFDVSLFRNRGYSVSLTAVSLSFFAMMGITFTLPFYFQILRGYDTLSAGMAFLPFAVGQLLAAPRSAKTVERFGYRVTMTVGLTIVAVSLIGLTRLQLDTPIWLVLLGFFLFGLGMGNVIAPATSVMQNVLPLGRAGAGSAVQNTVRQVSGALGIAVVGTVLGNQYASGVTSLFAGLPAQFPRAEAEQSVVATSAILDGVAAQGTLPAEQIDAVRQSAFESFLGAAHTTMTLSAVFVVIAALVVLFLLPHISPPRKGDESPADTWDSGGEATEEAVLHAQHLDEPATVKGPDGSDARASGS